MGSKGVVLVLGFVIRYLAHVGYSFYLGEENGEMVFKGNSDLNDVHQMPQAWLLRQRSYLVRIHSSLISNSHTFKQVLIWCFLFLSFQFLFVMLHTSLEVASFSAGDYLQLGCHILQLHCMATSCTGMAAQDIQLTAL